MPTNYPGEYAVELFYTVDNLEHKQLLSCNVTGTPAPGDLPSSIDVNKRDGTTGTLADLVDAYTDELRTRIASTGSIDRYDFWKYTEGTFTRQYITSGDVSKAGTNGGSTRLAGQDTYTFRTVGGGIMKIVVLETPTTGNVVQRFSELSTANAQFVNSILATGNWIVARDDTFPIAFLRFSNGENERIFNERYR